MQEIQVILTPEQRSGDFIDFTFKIEPESMGRVDSKVRLQQAYDFAQKILPAAMAAAQIAMTMGIPFSASAFILRMAKDAGIEWMDEVFYDPNFQQQMMMQQAMGPQDGGKGQPAPPGGPGGNMLGQIQQNGQPSSVMGGQPGAQEQKNAGAQEGANDAQRLVKAGMQHAFLAGPATKAPLANANAY